MKTETEKRNEITETLGMKILPDDSNESSSKGRGVSLTIIASSKSNEVIGLESVGSQNGVLEGLVVGAAAIAKKFQTKQITSKQFEDILKQMKELLT